MNYIIGIYSNLTRRIQKCIVQKFFVRVGVTRRIVGHPCWKMMYLIMNAFKNNNKIVTISRKILVKITFILYTIMEVFIHLHYYFIIIT